MQAVFIPKIMWMKFKSIVKIDLCIMCFKLWGLASLFGGLFQFPTYALLSYYAPSSCYQMLITLCSVI